MLGSPSAVQTEYFPAGATLGRKKPKGRNKTPKHWTPSQYSRTARCQLCLREADKQDRMLKE
jgi:hypothetical protein